MPQIPAKHTHKFSIADADAVRVLLSKLGTPKGSRTVDEEKLYQALHRASQRYSQSSGYAVGLKHK